MKIISDEQLIGAYLKGNEAAFAELLDRHLSSVYSFVYRYVGNPGDAEDITQDAFVSAWKNLKRFDRKKKFKTWIFVIAKNASLNWIKKKKPALFAEFENEFGENTLTEVLRDPSSLPDELFERKEVAEKLSRAIEMLAPRYREVLLLRYHDELTFREIAESLGEPLHTVKSRHRRGLMLLRKTIGRGEIGLAP